jgi:hypothetical protein
MSHKICRDDVIRAFERYKRITGDTAAHLEQHAAGMVVRYELEGEWRGKWFGAASATDAIEAYCDGYKDGREDGLAEAEIPEEMAAR